MSEQRPHVSVIIPLLNEEPSLQPLYNEMTQVLQALGQPYELLFVDDGSTDGSFTVLEHLHTADPQHVRAIRFRRNFGKTAALSLAFKRVRGDVVVTMDADLQDNPHELPKLLGKLDEGYDLVSAWRERRQDSASKRLPSLLANGVVSALSGIRLHDVNCGFKAYRADVVHELKLYGDLHRYIPVLAHWQGFSVAEVTVTHRARQFGQSKYGWHRFGRGFFDFLVVLFLTRYLRRPLQLFGTAGAVSLLFGLALGLYLTYLRFFGEGIGWRPALFLDLLAITVGVQFISMGLLGEMVRNFGYRSEDEYSIRAEL